MKKTEKHSQKEVTTTAGKERERERGERGPKITTYSSFRPPKACGVGVTPSPRTGRKERRKEYRKTRSDSPCVALSNVCGCGNWTMACFSQALQKDGTLLPCIEFGLLGDTCFSSTAFVFINAFLIICSSSLGRKSS